ncbi:MAG: hypothetical protein HGA67_03455 [Candidatus Yonathbacteria bacterium]|nr:hypothetical protein [Candidatus Yonathbacteria bacterium]
MNEKAPDVNHENEIIGEKLKHRLLTATELPHFYYDMADYDTYDDYRAAFFDWKSEELKNTTFSKDEAIALAHTTSRNSKESNRNRYYGTPMYDQDDISTVAAYILPLVPKDEQKEVLDDFISVLLDQVDREKKEHDDVEKRSEEIMKKMGLDPVSTFIVSDDVDYLRRSITQHPELLTDGQFLEIIDKVPPRWNIMGAKDYNYLPAWVLYGMRLRYGYRDADTKIIQAFDDETQKEKMKMAEHYFSKVTVPGMKISIPEMSPAEKEVLIEKVKEYILEIYEPIQSVTPDTPGSHFFTHVSNQPGLQCLLPKSSGKDRWGPLFYGSGENGGRMRAVYLQRDGNYDYHQEDMLSKANKGVLFTYPIYISKKDFENDDLIWEEDRWRNGYMTPQPVMLNGAKFTWDMLDRDFKEHVIERYEYHNGFLPADVRKNLLS